MGFMDFFRRKKVEQVDAGEKEKRFDDVFEAFSMKKKEIEEKETIFLQSVKREISELNNNIANSISVLEKINLKEKKEEEKVRVIVLENLNNYIISLKNLRQNLIGLDSYNGIHLINRINLAFSEFHSKSDLSFAKATYLIGRELEDVKISLRDFAKAIKEIESQNKKLIEEVKIFETIKKELEEMKNIDKLRSEINADIFAFESRINENEAKIGELENKINEIKKSDEYISQRNLEKEKEEKAREIDEKFYSLKEMIDFKELARIFHSNEKKMNVVKDYRFNFKELLVKDQEEVFMSLLEESGLSNHKIKKAFDDLKSNLKEMENVKVAPDEIIAVGKEIEEIKNKIDNVKSDKVEEGKKLEKFNLRYGNLKKEVIDKLSRIGVNLARD